jgi:hypothetical protein
VELKSLITMFKKPTSGSFAKPSHCNSQVHSLFSIIFFSVPKFFQIVPFFDFCNQSFYGFLVSAVCSADLFCLINLTILGEEYKVSVCT